MHPVESELKRCRRLEPDFLAFPSPPWCKVVKTGERHATMNGEKAQRKGMKSQRTALVRASISFPPDLYETLEEIANLKKVSLAWVVRDAAGRYAATEAKERRGGRPQSTAHRSVRRDR
jgi:hypothetical protein